MKNYINIIIRNVSPLYLLIFLAILISYILGFIFNEDSSGGGKIDFSHECTSFNEFKKLVLDALTSQLYESSRTPLFLILNK